MSRENQKPTPEQVKVIQACARDEIAFATLLELFTGAMNGRAYNPPLGNIPQKGNPKLTIMVVDDQLPIIESIQRFLEPEGYRVIGCANPLTAISMMESDVPDIAFLDIEMPDMDGGELLEKMRDRPKLKSIPVVFITGLVSPGEEFHLNHQGTHEFLGKPYTKAGLLKVIEKVMKSAES